MKNIDLRLLEIVSELSRTRSVSQTADNLNLSQSAVSMSLAKLRRHFNDPLFVRTSTGMEPTPHAAELLNLLQKAEALLQNALGHHVVFDPQSSNRKFTIHSTDIAQATLIPKLMRWINQVAPAATVTLHRISKNTARLLEAGEADVAIGAVAPMGAAFCQQRLFREQFVCLVRKDHPRIGDSLSIEEFESENHLDVSAQGTGHEVIARALASTGVQRKVGLTVPNYIGILPVLTALDYIAMVPEQLAHCLTNIANLKIVSLPFELPRYVIAQHWHERYTHDPASRWLRATIAQLVSPTSSSPTEPALGAPRPVISPADRQLEV